MKSLFDLLAIVCGIIGLAGIVLNAAPLTPDNAPVQSARAVIVLAFVVILYFTARAIEKVNVDISMKRLQHLWSPYRQPLPTSRQAPPQTRFFDYFFQVGSAHDWESSSTMDIPLEGSPDDNTSVG